MKVLGIDSSGMVATVAVVEDTQMLAEYTINYKKTHSQTLLPMLDEVAKMIELDLNTIDAIAVAAGPGSFTGLRIGSATAKGLGLALKKPLVSVPTLEGIAYNFCGSEKVICPMMDARRSQVYTGIYEFQENTLKVMEDQMAVPVEEVLEKLNQTGREVILAGDGVPVYLELIKKNLKVPYLLAPAHLNRQRAGAVAVLGIQYAKEGKLESAMEHQPDYLRLSQAERERAQKQARKEDVLTKWQAGDLRNEKSGFAGSGKNRKRKFQSSMVGAGICRFYGAGEHLLSFGIQKWIHSRVLWLFAGIG